MANGQEEPEAQDQQFYAALVQHSPYCIHQIDDLGRLVSMNPAGLRMMGAESPSEILGMLYLDAVCDQDRERVAGALEMGLAGNFSECEFVAENGRVFSTDFIPLASKPGSAARLMGITTDMTEQRALEQELNQSRKLDAIGRLAGGVAHDFNNLLTVILGAAELLKADVAASASAELDDIVAAATRASELTSQLLTFARRQIVRPRVIDLRARLEEIGSLLRRLLPENIALEITLPDEELPVRIDPGQVEQVIVNLTVNARDAMPLGGRLSIHASALDLESTAPTRLSPGPRAVLRVVDTGSGMDRDTLERVFEPFFTTKDPSRGTGLGLSTCHGIVGQAGGDIRVESKEGSGATFLIHLPLAQEEVSEEPRPPGESPARGATVLLVEDDPGVRRIAARALRGHGHEVLEAESGESAIEQAARAPGIDVLLTDVVLSGISGRVVADKLLAENPSLCVVFTSGYTNDTMLEQGIRNRDLNFLAKPYTPPELVAAVGEALRG